MEILNQKIIGEIIKCLPNEKKVIDYLVETLGIGKESAYRRFKGQIPFPFHEVALIAKDLDFSISKAIEVKKENNISFDMPIDLSKDATDIFRELLEYDISIIQQLIDASELNIIAAINRLPLPYFPYKTLFKFNYFRYLHSVGEVPLLAQFLDISVPSQVEKLHQEILDCFNRLQGITCIIDSVIFEKLIKEIQYYYRLKFISENDLYMLQNEMHELIMEAETIVRTGHGRGGIQYSIYYSFLDLDASCAYFEYDNKVMSQIWIYPESPITIKQDQTICKIQKCWLESKIRNSTLLTKSNDLLQIGALRELYQQVSDMTQVKNVEE